MTMVFRAMLMRRHGDRQHLRLTARLFRNRGSVPFERWCIWAKDPDPRSPPGVAQVTGPAGYVSY